MSRTYKYDHNVPHHLIRHVLVVGVVSLIVLIIVAGLIWKIRPKPTAANGGTKLVPQVQTAHKSLYIDEPYFSMELPIDWKQTGHVDAPTMHSISWQSSAKNATNRYLTIYIDTIPTTMAVNRELPITVEGNQLSFGQLSDNCANFTPGGTLDTAKAATLKPTTAVWQGISFICDLPDVVNNKVGTGSTAGINTVTIKGQTSGTHSYFFLYTDHNIQPDYSIFFNAIQSFRAK